MHEAIEQAAFGFELLAARGDLSPGSLEARRYIEASLKEVTMHEVGHALGLRHNFKGSSGIRLDQLRDPDFVRRRGTSNSVMDYNALNLPLASEAPAPFNNPTLGEYDYWAIEYAYRDLAIDRESEELARIAARSAGDSSLRYATDEDIHPQFGGGIDPLASQFDLGDDPLAYVQRSFSLARELWSRTERRQLAANDSQAVLRRNVQRGLNAFQSSVPIISRFVGGVLTSRETAGAGATAILTPVPPARQREALDVLAREVFSAGSFRFDPGLMQRLGVEHLERLPTAGAPPPQALDFSLPTTVLGIQRSALDYLMSDAVAARLADAESKVVDRSKLLSFAEVQARLSEAIWSEIKGGREIDSLRRNLQRDHVRRVAYGLVRPTSATAADVRPVNRQVALKLDKDLRRALARADLTPTTRAHLADSLEVLGEALKAPLMRQGV